MTKLEASPEIASDDAILATAIGAIRNMTSQAPSICFDMHILNETLRELDRKSVSCSWRLKTVKIGSLRIRSK